MELKSVLENFLKVKKISAKVISIENKHPLYRAYVEPKLGTEVSKITKFASELGLALKAKDKPIIQPLYSKGVVKIEVMLDEHPIVDFHKLEARIDASTKTLPCVLGTLNVTDPLVVDLKSAPHMLVGGTTGSGKSMILHSMINSLMAAAEKNSIRFTLIDPKHVEFSVYEDCKYLELPIVNTVDAANKMLDFYLNLMESRLHLLKKKKCRDWEEYRESKENLNKKSYHIIFIDELGDLFLASGSKLRTKLIQLVQKCRAAGIHVVVATQHPSAKVIPGELKANFPAVIGCKVASAAHSRVLFDSNGAESLLGKGDALLTGYGKSLQRFKGSLVDLDQVKINQLKMRKGIFQRIFN